MVKVRLILGRTGNQHPGDIIEVSPGEAERMVEAGQAEIIAPPKPAPKPKPAKKRKTK